MESGAMRTDAEIIAMCDQLERREWGHRPGELNDVALTMLRWACDQSRSDREVLDLSDTNLSGDTSMIDAIDRLADVEPNWDQVTAYLKALSSAKLETLRKVAGRLSRQCAAIRDQGTVSK